MALRKLVYRRIEGINIAACDSCAWTFNPENLEASSLEELKVKFQALNEKTLQSTIVRNPRERKYE
jgi:hypothetical protein